MDAHLLPVFPLKVVLFPEALLPLHLFEERYKRLYTETVETGNPFGVVLLRRGQEVGGPSTPYSVGTTARIRTHTVESEGRINIIVQGQRRFRIRRLDESGPYLRAETEWVDDEPCEEDLTDLVERLRTLFHRHVELLFQVIGRPGVRLTLPDSPEALSYFVSSRLRVSLVEKQELLELTSTPQRLEALAVLLARRNAVQETFLQLRPVLGAVHSDISVLMDAYVPEN